MNRWFSVLAKYDESKRLADERIRLERERFERARLDLFDSAPQFEPDVIARAIAANVRGLKG